MTTKEGIDNENAVAIIPRGTATRVDSVAQARRETKTRDASKQLKKFEGHEK